VNSTPYKRAVMASVILEFIPPLVRQSLFEDPSFTDENGIETEAMMTFGSNGVLFRRSELFDAVRAVLAGEAHAEFTDAEGRTWELGNDASEGELPSLLLSSGPLSMVVPDFTALSEDAAVRVRSLEDSASDVDLPPSAREEWRSILEARVLEDDEVDELHRDIRDTPVYMGREIRSEIAAGRGSLTSLVPNSLRYFERLVGEYDGSDSVTAYASGAGGAFIEQLLGRRPKEGLLYSLLLSSHSALTAKIDTDCLDEEMLIDALDMIERQGDMLSRLGAFEVGLRSLSERPEVEPFLLRLVDAIRDDDAESDASEYKLFSALFVLVDGELARTRLLVEKPPFYRRLAALAQAALIHRQFAHCGVNYERFSEWALSRSGEQYYMQSLADMRLEPRWEPDLAAASQLKADFLGRIMIAGHCYGASLVDGALRDTLLGDGERSIAIACEFPGSYLPGPLEGAADSPLALPDDVSRLIREALDTSDVEASCFVALVNSALVFRVETDHVELAAKALRSGNHTLANVGERSQLVGILNGLATLAAVSRNPALADEIRILVRRYRQDSQYRLTMEEAMRVCLVASAAREDLMEWRGLVGEWLTELAFGDLDGDEGEALLSHLLALLNSVPELWVSSARAHAALQAWCFR